VTGSGPVAPWEIITWLLVAALQTQSADYFGAECGFLDVQARGSVLRSVRLWGIRA